MARLRELPNELVLKIKQLEAEANKHKDKQHPDVRALWLELQKVDEICGSLTQKNGVFSVCIRTPEEGASGKRCPWHGGSSLKGDSLTPAQKMTMMKNLRPQVVQHGWYSSESAFVASLTEQEIQYMAYLEKTVREQYEVEDGLPELLLEEILQNAVIHMRMVNRGVFERGSKHTARPLQEALKTVKEMGWVKKNAGTRSERTQKAMDDILSSLDSFFDEDEDNNKSKTLN